MKFSVVVPIYGVEQYLDRCVDSLIHQSFQDLEIILVDDGSLDRCRDMCDDYQRMDTRVKVIHKVNGGLSDARNAGLKIAKGEYVLFVDADDYIDLKTCEQFAAFADGACDILIGDAVVEGDDDGKIRLEHIQNSSNINGKQYLLEAHRQRKMPVEVWLNAYRREFLLDQELFFKKGILHEDEQFIPRVFLKAEKTVYTGISFYHYILREQSITRSPDKRKNADDFYQTCCELEKIYRTLPDKELRNYLLDSLSEKYLGLFQDGKLFQFGKRYIHADMVRRNACLRKTVLKSRLYSISPRLYYYINMLSKKI